MLAAFLAFFLLFIPPSSDASNPQEEYRKLQEKLTEQKKKLNEAQERESSILGEIDSVNEKLSKTEAELGKYRRNLRRTEADIAAVDNEIAGTKVRLDAEKEWLKRKLRMMNRMGHSGDAVALLLSAEDVSQMMRIWKYLERAAARENRVMTNYRADLSRLDEESRKLQSLRAALRNNTEKVRTKENELAENRRSKEAVLSSVRSEKAAHQKMVQELRNASNRLLDIIRESAKKDTYSATGFTKLKGRLIWPAEGRIAIPYGSQKDPQFETPVFRNGVHIKTDSNTDAKAVYAGKVIFAEWFKGFGQLVIVNHGSGYHTLYGNLSEIFSHVGDIIKENQVIGKVGTSGLLSAPGLYFEIRYKGKPLDPSQWLRSRR